MHDRRETCRVYGGSHQNVSFFTCQKMCSCCFAWQAWHVVTFDVFQSGGMCVHDRPETKVAVSVRKATKTCLSLRVRRCAHVVLRGRRGAL